MPSTVFETHIAVSKFASAILRIGGRVTDVLACPPMFIVHYELPKKGRRKADAKRQSQAAESAARKTRKSKS